MHKAEVNEKFLKVMRGRCEYIYSDMYTYLFNKETKIDIKSIPQNVEKMLYIILSDYPRNSDITVFIDKYYGNKSIRDNYDFSLPKYKKSIERVFRYLSNPDRFRYMLYGFNITNKIKIEMTNYNRRLCRVAPDDDKMRDETKRFIDRYNEIIGMDKSSKLSWYIGNIGLDNYLIRRLLDYNLFTVGDVVNITRSGLNQVCRFSDIRIGEIYKRVADLGVDIYNDHILIKHFENNG